MKVVRLGLLITIFSLVTGIVAGCRQSTGPGALTDDLSREIRIDKAPQRIVSHVPGVTEILFALGLDEKIVGDSTYCDYPEAAKAKEKIGGYFDPSVEKIVALKPDMVLTDGYVEYLMPQLNTLSIPYLVVQPKGVDGILKDIDLIGKATGTSERADSLVKELQGRISSVGERVKNASRPRIFYAFDATDLNNPWTAGSGSFVDALIKLAGGENIAAGVSAPWVQFSIEQIVSSDPEIIILDAGMGTAVTGKEALERHSAWQKVTAVKQGKVYIVNGDLVNRAGPRIVEGLEEIAKIVHPDLFK